MKYKLLYPLSLCITLGLSCKKLDYIPPTPLPSGKFNGTFAYLHRHTNKVPYDTLKANITLNLKNTDGSFTVTGDTATLHAGSFGSYQINSSYINFFDKTFPIANAPTKKHLSGLYTYADDGAKLKILVYSADTVRYEYDLILSGN